MQLTIMHGRERENRIRTNDGMFNERHLHQVEEVATKTISPEKKPKPASGRCKHGDTHPRKHRPQED
jgi:hypothetical protein